MREILFKAKTCVGEWVQGLLAHKDNKWYISNKAGMPFAYEIRPDTICQYTGLNDNHGNKIWENDVVRCYADTDDLGNDLFYFYKVIWHERYCCWWLSDIHTYDDASLYDFNAITDVVLGNIFDNPELLEGGGEDE